MASGVNSTTGTRMFTGDEFLESLRDGREVWIYGERVKDVTTHPAFRNTARSVARLYDALHDPAQRDELTVETDTGSGGLTHPFFRMPRSRDDLVKSRDAIAGWQRQVYGFMGRTPDYKASFLATLGVHDEYYSPYQENARRWYRESQERVLYMNHALVNPPVDRGLPPEQTSDVYVHVENETDNGIVVSGAKVVATASVLNHHSFIAHVGAPLTAPEYAVIFICPMGAPGVKLLARASYEAVAAWTGSPFDYPLSSRLDENDAILVFDRVEVPWENVLLYRDVEGANAFLPRSGFTPRFTFHSMIRLAVKLDFISGLVLRAIEITGTGGFRGVQAAVGEIVGWRHIFWGLVDGMIQGSTPWVGGSVQPSMEIAMAYRMLGPMAYGKIKQIIEENVGSGLIYLNSNARDFAVPEIRPYLDKYLRGSGGATAVDRVQLMKLLWDAIGSEFGGRHELYERNYAGNQDDIRTQLLGAAHGMGLTEGFRELVERCMSEYDLDGWKLPGMIDPSDVSVLGQA